MKVQGFGIESYLPSVRERKEGRKSDQGTQQDSPKQEFSKQESPTDEGLEQDSQDDREILQKEVEKTIQSFKEDAHAQACGLNASLIGPGLTVVLKDCEGEVIRKLTGQEFIRLRRTGKILDRKL